MLVIENLCVSYNHKIILDDLQVCFDEGCVHGLVGLNGSGKTTLLNTIYGFKRPDSGTILYNGTILKRTDMSYLETENHFYSNITGREYLSLFKPSENTRCDDDWNKLFGLPLDQLIDSYSTGMKKKLALMAVLKLDKTIVILDEPFNGLDIEASKILNMLIAKFKEVGRTIIITSHILESLTNICDHIHYLNNRKIAFSKNPDDFTNLETEIFRDMEEKYSGIIDYIL